MTDKDLNIVPFNDRRREGSGLDPEDPVRYQQLLGLEQLAAIEQWTYNFRVTFGRKMKVPVALYDHFKASGGNTKDMEPVLPHMY